MPIPLFRFFVQSFKRCRCLALGCFKCDQRQNSHLAFVTLRPSRFGNSPQQAPTGPMVWTQVISLCFLELRFYLFRVLLVLRDVLWVAHHSGCRSVPAERFVLFAAKHKASVPDAASPTIMYLPSRRSAGTQSLFAEKNLCTKKSVHMVL